MNEKTAFGVGLTHEVARQSESIDVDESQTISPPKSNLRQIKKLELQSLDVAEPYNMTPIAIQKRQQTDAPNLNASDQLPSQTVQKSARLDPPGSAQFGSNSTGDAESVEEVNQKQSINLKLDRIQG